MTKDGERPRACHYGLPFQKDIHDGIMADAERDIAWLREAVERRDWYAVERLAKRLQQDDPMRAFDHIDLFNMGYQ